MEDNSRDVARGYEPPPKDRGFSIGKIVKWGGLAVVILGLGTCVWTFAGLFKDMTDRAEASRQFVEQVSTTGLPPASDPIYAESAGVTDEQLQNLQALINAYGNPTSVGEPSCSAKTGTDMGGSYSYADCHMTTVLPNTTGFIDVTWTRENEEWKLYRYYHHVDDPDARLDAPEPPADE